MRRSLIAAVLLALPTLVNAQVQRIDSERLAAEVAGGTVLIDIRTLSEWKRSGVVPGSHLMTFFDERGRHDAPAFLERLATIVEPGQPVALICHSGVRSALVGRLLHERAGYGTVYDATGGVVAWGREGRQLDAAETAVQTPTRPARRAQP